MSLIYIFAGATGIWISGYYGFKIIRKSILKELNQRFVTIREKGDAFDIHNEKIINKSKELTETKVQIIEIIEKEEEQIKIKEKKISELKNKNNLNSKDISNKTKLFEEIKKHHDIIKNMDNVDEIQILENELKELNLKSKHLAKIDIFDLAPIEKYFLSKHITKLIDKSKKESDKGLGAIEIHSEVGSKLYMRKYEKIMIIEGRTYFHNPAKVKNSWFGIPCEHFDEGDPEAKDMGNTMFYPMSGKELTALIYDQKIPDENKSGFELNKYVLYGIMGVVMIVYLFWILNKDQAQAVEVSKIIIQNATTIVK